MKEREIRKKMMKKGRKRRERTLFTRSRNSNKIIEFWKLQEKTFKSKKNVEKRKDWGKENGKCKKRKINDRRGERVKG